MLVLVKENHSFDNYFTGFPGAESATTAKLSTGTTLTRPKAPDGVLPRDICHSNACGQKAYATARWTASICWRLRPTRNLHVRLLREAQIPNYWQYARNFALFDHFFSTTLGPSVPGHAVFWMAQSPVLNNPACTKPGGTGCTGSGCTADAFTKVTAYDSKTCTTSQAAPCFDVPILVDHLPQGFTWIDYGGALALMAKSVSKTPNYQAHFRKQADLLADLTAGQVSNLMIGNLWSGDQSEHPPANPCTGENLTVEIINAAMKTPQWNEMAIIVTWDDWGGFYDHVAPAVYKCANGNIYNEGFRLPAIVISPYAKTGRASSRPRPSRPRCPGSSRICWGMEYMAKRDPHARDATAGSLMGAFDFTQTPRAPLLLTPRTCP